MPTHNPRLTITLEPSTAAQLRTISALTGNSQSQTVSEILTQCSEVFERMIRVLEAAELAKQAAREETASRLDRAQAKVEKQLGLMLDTMDDMSRPLLDHAEKIKRRRARTAPGVGGSSRRAHPAPEAPTPPSNRGVRSDPKTSGKRATMRPTADLEVAKRKRANPSSTRAKK